MVTLAPPEEEREELEEVVLRPEGEEGQGEGERRTARAHPESTPPFVLCFVLLFSGGLGREGTGKGQCTTVSWRSAGLG